MAFKLQKIYHWFVLPATDNPKEPNLITLFLCYISSNLEICLFNNWLVLYPLDINQILSLSVICLICNWVVKLSATLSATYYSHYKYETCMLRISDVDRPGPPGTDRGRRGPSFRRWGMKPQISWCCGQISKHFDEEINN
jgi:hypothetical protein